ncbi:hypothetical protein EV401DRAFT_1861758 [Pisolithus croceorrhizus]|nr:hypothetical protein EV401DRAFT_1861758 [Pisolithus croceorrhizus]
MCVSCLFSTRLLESYRRLSCRKHASRYTCPTCNVPYCSLICFRSETHAQCSETFYRKEITSGGGLDSSKTTEEREKILGILKRLDDEGLQDHDEFSRVGDEDDDDEGLEKRLAGLDIDSASADELLERLTEEERNTFFKLLRDPASEPAQKLLASTDLDRELQAPWWDSPQLPSDGSDAAATTYGLRPSLMEVPPGLRRWNPESPSLLYNVCSVFIAYAYVTRHLSMSPLSSSGNSWQDKREARRLIARGVPFIADRQSKLLHVSLTNAVMDVWARLDPGSVEPRTMAVLLGDVSRLVRPRKVVVAEGPAGGIAQGHMPSSEHPRADALRVFSDMDALFDENCVENGQGRKNYVSMKIKFYAGHLLAAPSPLLDSLADEAFFRSKSMNDERIFASTNTTTRVVGSVELSKCPAGIMNKPTK